MVRHTVNLGRARTVGRNKRAKKAVSILREKLERIEDTEVTLSREVNQKIWERGAEKPPSKIQVKITKTEDGVRAELAESRQEDQHTSSEEGSSEADYEEIVSNTVDDAKDAIEELDNPDYEKLLEAEKEGKDRKTLKDHIEGLKS